MGSIPVRVTNQCHFSSVGQSIALVMRGSPVRIWEVAPFNLELGLFILVWFFVLYNRKFLNFLLYKTLHRNLHKANVAREQRRGLKNFLISANLINVHFCSNIKFYILKGKINENGTNYRSF